MGNNFGIKPQMTDVQEVIQTIVSGAGGQFREHFMDERGFELEGNGILMI